MDFTVKGCWQLWMELKSRRDLIARTYNMVVPSKDEITFEVYMNHVVFAMARKKAAKAIHKDLQRFATSMTPTTSED